MTAPELKYTSEQIFCSNSLRGIRAQITKLILLDRGHFNNSNLTREGISSISEYKSVESDMVLSGFNVPLQQDTTDIKV